MNYGNHKLDVKFSKVFSSKCFVLYGVGNLGKFNFKRNEKCDRWIFNYEKAYKIYFSESQVVNELVNMGMDAIAREEWESDYLDSKKSNIITILEAKNIEEINELKIRVNQSSKRAI